MPAADWFLWLKGVALLAAASGLVYWAWRALFNDRANGQRRCPRCWYDMAYSPGMTCAECGFTARHEEQLERTRRRYGQAATAILLCVGLGLWVNYQASTSSWSSFIPTRALILALPLAAPEGDLVGELRKRMFTGNMSDRELAMLLRRCARGDWRARPPGSASEDAWIEKYGNALEVWRRALVLRGEVTGVDRRSIDVASAPYSEFEWLLMDIPAMLELNMPPQWPPRVQPRVQVRLRHWWPLGSEARVRLVREDDPDRVITFYNSSTQRAARFAAAVEGIDPAATEVTFRVTVDRRRPGLDEPWRPGSKHVVTFPIEIREGLEPWPEPVDDEAIREAMREVFAGHATAWASGPVPVRFSYNPRMTLVPEMDGLAIAVAMQLRRDDELARQLNIWWLGGMPKVSDGRWIRPTGLGWEVAYENHELLAEISGNDDRWHFHIEGRPELAMLAGEAERHWSGSFTAPLRLTRVRTPPPAPEWWREEQQREQEQE